jgi:type II secretory pathway pseudopilin PulG
VAQPSDRYEPLPALPELPRWLWRKMGRWARVAVILIPLAAAVAAVVVVPGLRGSQREADERVQQERAAQRAELARRLAAEQRPIAGRSDAVAADAPLAARARTMDGLGAAIRADASARVRRGELDGTIRRVTCEPFPRSLGSSGADRDLSRRRGRFACVAVTAEFERTSDNPGGVIGHAYRALVDFAAGRFSFCKITGRAGPEREQIVTIPRACGGD